MYVMFQWVFIMSLLLSIRTAVVAFVKPTLRSHEGRFYSLISRTKNGATTPVRKLLDQRVPERKVCYIRSLTGLRSYSESLSSDQSGPSDRKKRKLAKHMQHTNTLVPGAGSGGGGRGRSAYVPRTSNQQIYVDALNDPSVPVVFGIGPAGSGKTMFACLSAVNALKSGAVSRIVMTRPVVSVDEQLGFLPGDIQRKMDPWVRPLFDVLLESSYSQIDIDRMIAHGVIEIAPLGFMRGRTFKHTFVLADELQNSTPGQMMMLLTRIGEGCKMVVTGDVGQSDLRGVNGLADFMARFQRASGSGGGDISLCELDSGDIQRSAVVQRVHDMYHIKTGPLHEGRGGAKKEDAAMIPYTSLPKHL
jgi:phosphate starvation-inducible protein PhoH